MTGKANMAGNTQDHGLALWREMLRIRCFEERCIEAYQAQKIRGFLHVYIGEEAVAVGAMQALRPEDAIVATYREHGHALARGIPAERIMAEMFGRLQGCSKGRGGSMHIFDAATRFYGGNAIVGGGLPIAVGLALADRMQGRSNITACFFGEGAVAEGDFHESINLAALWRLPILFLCENNLYAMGTRLELSESQTELYLKAQSYNVLADEVDGMDVCAVEAAARKAAESVRAGYGPYFLELRTYRFRGHSMFDAELYRDKAEVEQWRQYDPIPRFRDHLAAHEAVADDAFLAIERAVEEEMAAATAFAEAGDWEPVESLAADVYARMPAP